MKDKQYITDKIDQVSYPTPRIKKLSLFKKYKLSKQTF